MYIGGMKHCNRCNTSKPLNEFSKSKAAKDGLQTKCKECVKPYNKQYKQDNKESRKQYNQDNKESRLEYQNQYNQDNKESINEYLKQYRQDNKESINENQLKLAMSEGYGVYTLTHLPTQCYYVGEGQIYNRRHQHFSQLKTGVNECSLLQEHYNKHPNIDDWEFKVIYKFDDYDKETGKELEAFIIEESREKYPTQILNKQV